MSEIRIGKTDLPFSDQTLNPTLNKTKGLKGVDYQSFPATLSSKPGFLQRGLEGIEAEKPKKIISEEGSSSKVGKVFSNKINYGVKGK